MLPTPLPLDVNGADPMRGILRTGNGWFERLLNADFRSDAVNHKRNPLREGRHTGLGHAHLTAILDW